METFSISKRHTETKHIIEYGQTRFLESIAPEREALYEYCEKEGIAIDVMKVFGGGNLLKAESSPIGKAFTPVQCLEYVLTRPAVAAAMCGVHSLEQLESDLAWCTATPHEKVFVTLLADVNKYLNLAKSQGEVPETVQDHYNLLAHHGSDCIECGKCETRCPFEGEVIWNGGNGIGTIQLFDLKGKLIDRIHADNVGCEYGEYC